MGGFDDWFQRLSRRASLSGYVAIERMHRLRMIRLLTHLVLGGAPLTHGIQLPVSLSHISHRKST